MLNDHTGISLRRKNPMITAAQMRAARALLGIDQRQLAELSGVSLPTIQRMEASEGNVRGVVDTLTKVVEAFDNRGIELIGENVESIGKGRGVRFKQVKPPLPAGVDEKAD
jgi:transcriptional regulator with XRE-family HTH domain